MHSQNLNPNSLLHHVLLLLLPEEIIEEIVSRLPVKSLLRFRCVSKSWLSLIESDRFIKLHLKNSTKNTSFAHHRVVYDVKEGVMSGCSLPSLLNSNSKEVTSSSSSSIIIDPTNNLPKADFLVGCCNGVLCLLSNYRDGNFSLWNPATRVFMELPKLKYKISTKCGFGWDESSGAFKVFASTNADYNQRSGQVYSSKTNSWKPVSLGSTSLFSAIGVFVGGRIHWAMGFDDSHEHVIECFNLENDEFGRIELPQPFNANANGKEGCRPFALLGEIGGRLCTLFDYNKSVDVWVMKEYGVKESWFKLITSPLDNVCHPRLYKFPPLFGEGLNEEIFIIVGCIFMALLTATNIKTLSRGSIYVERLVSPQTTPT